MTRDTHRNRASGGELMEFDPHSLAELAASLTSIVEEMEADCENGRTIERAAVERLHGLRRRADHFLLAH